MGCSSSSSSSSGSGSGSQRAVRPVEDALLRRTNALCNRDLATVRRMLQHEGVDLTVARTTADRETALHLATRLGFTELVEVLVDAGVEVDTRNARGETALHLAARSGATEVVVRLLLSAGADKYAECYNGWMPLHLAVRFGGNPDTVKALLRAGTCVDRRSWSGWAPLHLAAWDNQVAMTKVLLQASACLELEATDQVPGYRASGQTALHVASRCSAPDVAALLLQAGAWVNNPSECVGMSPLHFAVRNGDTATVTLLLQAGANPNATTRIDLSYDSIDAVIYYTREPLPWGYGIRAPYSAGGGGFTPLHLALTCKRHSAAIVELLVRAGADLDMAVKVKKDTTRSPLALALSNAHLDSLAMLLRAGAVASEPLALCIRMCCFTKN